MAPFHSVDGLQLIGEKRLELLDLGANHRYAVPLIRVVGEIILVVVLGDIKRGQRLDGRDDGVVPKPNFFRSGQGSTGNPLLLFIQGEDG